MHKSIDFITANTLTRYYAQRKAGGEGTEEKGVSFFLFYLRKDRKWRVEDEQVERDIEEEGMWRGIWTGKQGEGKETIDKKKSQRNYDEGRKGKEEKRSKRRWEVAGVTNRRQRSNDERERWWGTVKVRQNQKSWKGEMESSWEKMDRTWKEGGKKEPRRRC